MESLFQSLVFLVPALVVLGACFLLVKQFLDNDQRLRMIEFRKSITKETLPLRLQAYERLLIFLERITPSSLLLRINQPGYTSKQLQIELLLAIRNEFEHNMSQQLYVSADSWIVIKKAKEDVIHIINIAMQHTGDNKTGAELGRTILELMIKHDNVPTQPAIDFLKKEGKMLM